MTLLERSYYMLRDVQANAVEQGESDSDWLSDMRVLVADLREAVELEQDRTERARMRRRCGV